MGIKQLTLLAAALIASAPAHAEDQIQNTVPMTMFYISIPLGAATARQQMPSYGLAIQGKRQYESIYVDNRMINTFAGALAGIEAKWLIAGGLAVAGGVYLSKKNDDRSSGYSGNQNNQQNSPPPPPPCDPDPCKK